MPTYRLIPAGLLFLAVAPLPYAYYQLLRWAVCGVAGVSAYEEFHCGARVLAWLFIGVAILFNPLAPISLDRASWFWIDVGTGVFFLTTLLFARRRGAQSQRGREKCLKSVPTVRP